MNRRKILISIACISLFSCGGESSRSAGDQEISGEKIYKTHCAICHGDDGRKGFADAKVLPESTLTETERIQLITNGRGTMMPYSGVLSEKEIEAVAKYTLSLR
jgi:cytochrome c6